MPQIELLRLGKTLRERRGERGIRQVAGEIGISPATLSRVERGKLPDLATFSRICEWLQVDPAEVLEIKKLSAKAQATSETVEGTILAAHFRAESSLPPEAAHDLAQMILAAHRAVAKGRSEL